MNNSITLKNLEICRNSILYFLLIQIPGNENIISSKKKFSKNKSPAGTLFYQVDEPKLTLSDININKIDLIDAADKFVLGYISKFIDIYVMNNYSKFIAKKSQVSSMYRSIFHSMYILSGAEILHYMINDNNEFIENDNANFNIQRFGIGSFAALYDYLQFTDDEITLPSFLNLYLTRSKDLILKVLEEKLIEQINKKDIYKNDLYITTIEEIYNFPNVPNQNIYY